MVISNEQPDHDDEQLLCSLKTDHKSCTSPHFPEISIVPPSLVPLPDSDQSRTNACRLTCSLVNATAVVAQLELHLSTDLSQAPRIWHWPGHGEQRWRGPPGYPEQRSGAVRIKNKSLAE